MSGQLPAGSVLPTVAVERTAAGVALVHTASARRRTWRNQLVGGGALTLVGAGGTGLGLSADALLSFPYLIALFPLASGVWFLVKAGRGAHGAATLGDARLELPAMPLRLGEPMPVRFTQQRSGATEITDVDATLTCQEWVRYRQGTDTVTRTHELLSRRLPPQPNDPVGTGGLIRGAWTLTIPPELPPSFVAADNAIQWHLTIRAHLVNRPDAVARYLLAVAPEVARDLR